MSGEEKTIINGIQVPPPPRGIVAFTVTADGNVQMEAKGALTLVDVCAILGFATAKLGGDIFKATGGNKPLIATL